MTTTSISSLPVIEAAPLSPGQQRLIAAEFVDPDGAWPPPGTATRMRPLDTGAVLIEGPLEVAALGAALDALSDRQSALRTVLRQLPDGTALQLVLRQGRVPFTRSTLHLADGESLPEGPGLAALAGPGDIDPRQGPLFRAHLVELGDGRHILLLQIHHTVSDGWSISVLYRDLSALYNAAVTGDAPDLPPLPHSFAWFARQMHTERSGDAYARQRRYWRTRLAPPLAPVPVPADPARTHPVDVLPVTVAAPVVAALRVAARSADNRGGVAGAFLAALALVLHHAGAGDDIRIGTMISNRARPDTENLIGYFVNTTVIRLRVTPQTTAGRLVTAGTLAVTEAIENQALPIQDIVQDLRESGALGNGALYDTTVALNTMREGTMRLHGLHCRDLDVEARGPREAPTSIVQRWVLEEIGGQLGGTLTHRTDVLSSGAARAVLHNLGLAMQAVTDRTAVAADILAGFAEIPRKQP
ncbi:hypothetical protein J2S43_001005 [Catenuloplanes nepalensis]|uniref:Condensation domain-containing protein n=1 Tax=Catenuloplanes nepalensis TaxID=587533 RepID=A0ABT9MM71_9ACTN|nr:condensation domain-containing protein [Catenuloplanes nepalensis]MDP9792493.1 hypothetical protein [Catenuloplanes nepalensis]